MRLIQNSVICVYPWPDQSDGLAQNGWRETVMKIDGFLADIYEK